MPRLGTKTTWLGSGKDKGCEYWSPGWRWCVKPSTQPWLPPLLGLSRFKLCCGAQLLCLILTRMGLYRSQFKAWCVSSECRRVPWDGWDAEGCYKTLRPGWRFWSRLKYVNNYCIDCPNILGQKVNPSDFGDFSSVANMRLTFQFVLYVDLLAYIYKTNHVPIILSCTLCFVLFN